MSTLKTNGIVANNGTGPTASLPQSGGSNFQLGPNWGVWEFVSTAAITAVANLSVTSLAAGYDYLFQLENYAPTTDANILWMRVSEDNLGTAAKSGASDYAWGSGLAATKDDADSELEIGIYVTQGNDAGNSNLAGVTIINPNASGDPKMVEASGFLMDGAATPALYPIQSIGKYYGSTNPVNAVQFGWSTNYGTDTFKAQGDITVWRRRRS